MEFLQTEEDGLCGDLKNNKAGPTPMDTSVTDMMTSQQKTLQNSNDGGQTNMDGPGLEPRQIALAVGQFASKSCECDVTNSTDGTPSALDLHLETVTTSAYGRHGPDDLGVITSDLDIVKQGLPLDGSDLYLKPVGASRHDVGRRETSALDLTSKLLYSPECSCTISPASPEDVDEDDHSPVLPPGADDEIDVAENISDIVAADAVDKKSDSQKNGEENPGVRTGANSVHSSGTSPRDEPHGPDGRASCVLKADEYAKSFKRSSTPPISSTTTGTRVGQTVRPWELSPARSSTKGLQRNPHPLHRATHPPMNLPMIMGSTSASTYNVQLSPYKFYPQAPPLVPNAYSTEQLRAMLLQAHTALRANLDASMGSGAFIASLTRLYYTEVERIESQRYQALLLSSGSEYSQQSLQYFYDSERLHLIQHTQQQLNQCRASNSFATNSPFSSITLRHGNTSSVNRHSSHLNVGSSSTFPNLITPACKNTPSPVVPTCDGIPLPGPIFNTPPDLVKWPGLLSTGPTDSQTHMSSSTSKADSACQSTTRNEGPGKSRKFLNRHAVQLMEEWYQQNFDHPYPDDDTVDRLSTQGGVTILQVKKWMANKRVRSFNTLSFNGSIHPKKLKRLHRQQVLFTGQLQRLMQKQNGMPAPPQHVHCPASEMLNQWYDQNHQIPADDVKMQLAQITGLTINQVRNWFTNRHFRAKQQEQNLQQTTQLSQHRLLGKHSASSPIHTAGDDWPFAKSSRSSDDTPVSFSSSHPISDSDLHPFPKVAPSLRESQLNLTSKTSDISFSNTATDVDPSMTSSDSPDVARVTPCGAKMSSAMASVDIETSSDLEEPVLVMSSGGSSSHLNEIATSCTASSSSVRGDLTSVSCFKSQSSRTSSSVQMNSSADSAQSGLDHDDNSDSEGSSEIANSIASHDNCIPKQVQQLTCTLGDTKQAKSHLLSKFSVGFAQSHSDVSGQKITKIIPVTGCDSNTFNSESLICRESVGDLGGSGTVSKANHIPDGQLMDMEPSVKRMRESDNDSEPFSQILPVSKYSDTNTYLLTTVTVSPTNTAAINFKTSGNSLETIPKFSDDICDNESSQMSNSSVEKFSYGPPGGASLPDECEESVRSESSFVSIDCDDNGDEDDYDDDCDDEYNLASSLDVDNPGSPPIAVDLSSP